jgi:hypothetical protein
MACQPSPANPQMSAMRLLPCFLSRRSVTHIIISNTANGSIFLSFSHRNLFVSKLHSIHETTTMLKHENSLIQPFYVNYEIAGSGSAGPNVPVSLSEYGQVANKIPSMPFSTLHQNARSKYFNLRRQKQIAIFHLGTFQGRNTNRDSTNGCTVISPLVAVNHLTSEGAGISDMKIEQVIDEIAPVILSRVRRKLGLSGHALIIPSDVHDYLVDEKILKQEMFVGVCGGNLLDSTHVGEFLNLLESGEDSQPNADREKKKDMSKKVAAALFFHEHVVSILKVVLADGTMWYDLVDSMPNRITKNGKDITGATRTRCKDRQSLESLLYWYACEKFSPPDSQYIDANEWDDNMCDFDPRVFQGFVWKE